MYYRLDPESIEVTKPSREVSDWINAHLVPVEPDPCNVCGHRLDEIRGRSPDEPNRKGCFQCFVEESEYQLGRLNQPVANAALKEDT